VSISCAVGANDAVEGDEKGVRCGVGVNAEDIVEFEIVGLNVG
jgi:hypothetical protein